MAAGFVLTIADGPVLYHAGDTAVFGDMKLIRELYQPEVAMLPIGGHFTMGPKEAALAAALSDAGEVLPLALWYLSAADRHTAGIGRTGRCQRSGGAVEARENLSRS